MELTLNRRRKEEAYTTGRLSVNGTPFCDTLEDKVRQLTDKNKDGDFDDAGEGKVYGDTAIPEGRYRVTIAWWEKHKKNAPMINNVPGFKGILIHAGATNKDTLGCILVGRCVKPGKLENGPYYSKQLTEMIQAAINNKEEVYITIN